MATKMATNNLISNESNCEEYAAYVKAVNALVNACIDSKIECPSSIRFDEFVLVEIYYKENVVDSWQEDTIVESIRIYDGYRRGSFGDKVVDIKF